MERGECTLRRLNPVTQCLFIVRPNVMLMAHVVVALEVSCTLEHARDKRTSCWGLFFEPSQHLVAAPLPYLTKNDEAPKSFDHMFSTFAS